MALPRVRRRFVVRAFAGALIAVLLLLGFSGCIADALILGSNRQRIDPGTLRRHDVRADGRTVECWVARSAAAAEKEPEGFVIFFVGKADRAERWTAAVAEAWGGFPVEVWGMNYPGSGGSAGPAKLDAVAPAAVAVFDEVKRRAGDRPVFAHAASFGTVAALSVAARRPFDGLVLENPPPLRQLVVGHHGWWNLWLLAGAAAAQVPDDLDSITNARRSSAPAVFILHEQDEVVPPKYQRRVADAYAGPNRVVSMPGKHAAPLTREASDAVAAGRAWMWQSARERQQAYTPGPRQNSPP